MEDDQDSVSEEEFNKNGLDKKDMHTITQHVRVLSMQMSRYRPLEWNEFLIVALDS